VKFSAPAVPPAPDGVTIGSAAVVITPADTTATTTPGHNGVLAYRTLTRWPAPAFAPAGQQFTPTVGPPGTLVTLAGIGFDVGDLVVRFGDVQAEPPLAVTATSIQVTVPTGLLAGGASRRVPITVSTAGGAVQSDDTFTVAAAPRFAAPGAQFTPAIGPVGTLVTLAGTGFDAGGLVVRFGDIQTEPPLVVTATSIQVTVPEGASRRVPITVSTLAGAVTSTDTFTVAAPPRFAAPGKQITPHLGPQGKEVLLAGSGFDAGMVVRFGSVETRPIAPPKPFAAWVTVPAALQTGSEMTITVTTVAGTDTSTDRFRVLSEFDRSVRVLSQTGRAVPNIPVFRFQLALDVSGEEVIDEILDGTTDRGGRWNFRETTFGRVFLVIGGPGWTGIAATLDVDNWIGERLETINEAPNGGTVVLLSWTSIPGLDGELAVESDRPQSREVNVYTRDITINGSSAQPVTLEKGKPAHAVDTAGHKCLITIIQNFEKFGLLQYAKE
jgi:hypothetical protein